jgi:hypothetical protein
VTENMDFMKHLMHFALTVSDAERAVAFDAENRVLAYENISEEDIYAPTFSGFQNVAQALAANEQPHITNNMILEPNLAPTTNTNFANLRLVVVFPLGEYGSVYIDQHVRRGVVDKARVHRIQTLMSMWIASGSTDLVQADMIAAFEAN